MARRCKKKNSLTVAYYYQPDLLARHTQDKKAKETRVYLPHFYGKDDVDIFLD